VKKLIENILIKLYKIATLIDEVKNIDQLERGTPRKTKIRANEIRVRLKTITKKGKYIYETFTPSTGKKYTQFIKPVPPSTKIKSIKDNVIVHCSCPDFKYRHEVSLWSTDASHIISSNGAKPVITNPSMKKMLCKHLISVIKDLQKRIS